jgi:hypothetical protein
MFKSRISRSNLKNLVLQTLGTIGIRFLQKSKKQIHACVPLTASLENLCTVDSLSQSQEQTPPSGQCGKGPISLGVEQIFCICLFPQKIREWPKWSCKLYLRGKVQLIQFIINECDKSFHNPNNSCVPFIPQIRKYTRQVCEPIH